MSETEFTYKVTVKAKHEEGSDTYEELDLEDAIQDFFYQLGEIYIPDEDDDDVRFSTDVTVERL